MFKFIRYDIVALALALALFVAVFVPDSNAARTSEVWQERLGSYIETIWPEGRNILINGANKYLNFGSISGSSGYGFRDNGGTIQFKHNSGLWADVGSGSGGGGATGGGGLATTSIDTEVELESILTDVTNVFTNNDGALDDDDVSQADVTAHEAALTITESQISDLDHYTDADINGTESAFTGWDKNASDDFDGVFSSLTSIPAGLADGDDDTQLSSEQVYDYIGDYVSGPETLITVTDNDSSNFLEFTVEDDLSQYDNTTSGFLSDVVDDTTPQLGGNLDGQSNDITGISDLTASTARFGGAAALRSFNIYGTGLNGRLSIQGGAGDNPGLEMTTDGNDSRVLLRLQEVGTDGTSLQIYTEPESGAIANTLTVNADGTLTFHDYDCTGNANGGVLTTDGSGKVSCADDDGGSGGGGTVTSVAASVPTGWTISGSPITGAGTLAFGYDTGYSAVLTASTTDWQTAFGWGDHAAEGYLTTVDISDDTNLSGDSEIVLSGDTLSIASTIARDSELYTDADINGTESAFTGWDKNASDDFDGVFSSLTSIPAGLADGDDDTQLTNEQVEDLAGAMVTGNTETLITATYQDVDGTFDFVVNDDLSLYDNTTSGFITGYSVTESDVTTHEAALTITESQISDLDHYTDADINGTESAFTGWDKNASDDFDGVFSSLTSIPAGLADGDDDTQLSSEQVYDYVGDMLVGTETLITVTHQDASNDIDFVVNDDLSLYDNTTSGFLTSVNNTNWSGTDLSLANGGTGASLTDPNNDRIMFWDDGGGSMNWLTAGTGLTISGTDLNALTSSVSQSGIVELATNAETVAGTDANRAVTPDGLTERLLDPGPIGSTTPDTGNFTEITADSLRVTGAGTSTIFEGNVEFQGDVGGAGIDGLIALILAAAAASAAGIYMTMSNGTRVVIHGATASTSRPSGFANVTWIGSVEPTNATNNDIWYDTSA